MSGIYVLEWAFTPDDYFEGSINLDSDHGSFNVTPGKVELYISPDKYPADHRLRVQIHENLEIRFIAKQIFTHRMYTLNKPNVSRLHHDGRKDAWVFPDGVTMTASVGKVDVMVMKDDGSILRSTKLERADREAKFTQLTTRFSTDPVGKSMLRGYQASVSNPQSALVHLYEILDALRKHFTREKLARDAIGVSEKQWERIGKLANSPSLVEGRHRGKQFGELCNAAPDELDAVREIARTMIERYFQYLESKT